MHSAGQEKSRDIALVFRSYLPRMLQRCLNNAKVGHAPPIHTPLVFNIQS